MKHYEDKALSFAEKYGIVEYEVNENEMSYKESFGIGVNKEVYECVVNLDDMKETRKLRK